MNNRKHTNMRWLIAVTALCLSAIPVKATEVYWVDKDNHVLQQWHIEDKLNTTWFKSEDKNRCLEQVAVMKAAASSGHGWDRAIWGTPKEEPNK
jgi:hypothetical protein